MPPPERRAGPAPEVRPASANYHSNALARGLSLLEHLAGQRRPRTLSQLSAATGIPKGTVARLLDVLCERDYAVRVGRPPAYRLGHNVHRLSAGYLAALELPAVAERYLAPLAERTGQTANLGVRDGDHVLHACVSEPPRPLRFLAPAGTRDHLYCTGLGKLLLSRVPPSALPECLPAEPFRAFTERTITTVAELERALRVIRRRGYSVDDGERSPGLRCVAVPVEVGGECLAAISVSGPAGEFGPARQRDYAEELGEAARRMAADPDIETALRIVHRSLPSLGGPAARP